MLCTLVTTDRAGAFERQWRVGAGAGVATLEDAPLGPAVGIHGAYGLSDVFDVNLELLASRHGREDPTDVLGASAGLSYKIDILEWVPYVSVMGGYYYFGGPPGPGGARGSELGASFGGGLDYSVTRAFGIGAQARVHTLLTRRLSLSYFSATLRAEYRWGW